MKYGIVDEKAGENYSAYLPDLPGCTPTGNTIDETRKNIREAITFHLAGLREDGVPLPSPTSLREYVEAN